MKISIAVFLFAAISSIGSVVQAQEPTASPAPKDQKDQETTGPVSEPVDTEMPVAKDDSNGATEMPVAKDDSNGATEMPVAKDDSNGATEMPVAKDDMGGTEMPVPAMMDMDTDAPVGIEATPTEAPAMKEDPGDNMAPSSLPGLNETTMAPTFLNETAETDVPVSGGETDVPVSGGETETDSPMDSGSGPKPKPPTAAPTPPPASTGSDVKMLHMTVAAVAVVAAFILV